MIINCKKHGSQKATFYTNHNREPEVTYADCLKCCEEDRVNQFKRREKQRQFDELAKEAEAQEALEADAKIENLKTKMTNDKTDFALKKYRCPKHGIHENYITSTIPGIEGIWCQLCALEKLDELGVHRLEEVEKILTEITKENDKK